MPTSTRLALKLPILFGLLMIVYGLASAQTIYKSTMPDGSVQYGDAPVPGAVKVESGQAPESKGVAPVTGAQQQRIEEKQTKYFDDLERARAEVDTAQAELTQAQAARDAGQEPQPGERVGHRLQPAYFQRLQELDNAVTQAQERLHKAQTALKQIQLP